MTTSADVSLSLHDGFPTMSDAIEKAETYLHKQFQPMRRETKETVRNFNKKCRKAECQISELADDAQYSQR